MKPDVDFSYVETRHDKIHYRLEEWNRWVRVGYTRAKSSPMFAQYRSHAWQWEMPVVSIPIDTNKAHEVEREVSALPYKHRDALRWRYVFWYVPVNQVRKHLGVTREGLHELVVQGRDMLKNRMKL